ncbi:MAG: TRAP transporter small permease subunit [Burkholderiaceae bacterium]
MAHRLFTPSFGRVLLRTERAIRRLGVFTAIVLLPALIGVRLIEIILRGVLNKPGSLFNAMEGELFVMFVFMAIAAAYLNDAHVRVDILRDRLSRRSKSLIEIAGTLLFVLPVSLIVIWYGADMTYSTYAGGERAAIALGAPARWLIVATVPLGVGLFCVAVLARTIRHLGYLLTGQTARKPTDD